MALANRFIPYNASIKCTNLASAFLMQLKSYSLDLGVTIQEEASPGSLDRDELWVSDVTPKLPLVTTDLTFLSSCGMLGISIIPANSKPGFVAFGRNVPLGGVQDAIATASHVKVTVSDGLLVPVALRASHNQLAELSLLLHAILGTTATYSKTNPMLIEKASALVDSGYAVPKLFTAGPAQCTYSAATRIIQGIKDVSVNFGLNVKVESDSGNPYPSHASIYSRMPTFEFTTNDLAFAADVGEGLSVTSFSQFFRAIGELGIRVGGGSDLSVNTSQGLIKPGAMNLQNRTPGTAAFTYYPTSISGGAVVSISTSDSCPA